MVSCTKPLETALRSLDRDLVHFLHREGFITPEVLDDVLNPRLLSGYQKAGELVASIRNKVELSAQNYHTLMNHLRQSGKQYGSIVDILDREYSRQDRAGTFSYQLCQYFVKVACHRVMYTAYNSIETLI